MKKIKIMLSSLALLAVVGGALAFKAKFDKDFCTTQIDGDNCAIANLKCPNAVAKSKIDPNGTAVYCTTTKVGACDGNTACFTTSPAGPVPSVSLVQDF